MSVRSVRSTSLQGPPRVFKVRQLPALAWLSPVQCPFRPSWQCFEACEILALTLLVRTCCSRCSTTTLMRVESWGHPWMAGPGGPSLRPCR